MSTRSRIGIRRKDGSIDSIYCHSDGYLEYNGKLLFENYKSRLKIERLIKLGDISSLDKKIEPNPKFEHDFYKRQNGVVVAYARDRGNTRVDFVHHKNGDEFCDYIDSMIEYVYLYDEENKIWLACKIPYPYKNKLTMKPLEYLLKAENIV